MSSGNSFDLLGDDDNDGSLLIAAAQQKVAEKQSQQPIKKPAAQAQPAKPAAKLPSKPLPPAQAVRESRSEGGRGGRGGGRGGGGRGRGGAREFNRDSNNEATFGNNNGFSGGYRPSEEGEGGKPSERRNFGGPRGGFRGGRRGGFSNGETGEGERPRRFYERRSGTGRGSEMKREGSGRGNWGTASDEIAPETLEPAAENEKDVAIERPAGEEDVADANKDIPTNESEEKEPEDKEMTLEEYQKILEEKKKSLIVSKAEERKVDVEKEFGSMQLLSNKKSNDEIFVKLGSEKDKRKEAADKEDRAKKAVSINEFLKPAGGESHYGGRGRGRGRGRGPRGGYGGYGRDAEAPSIEDHGHFPSLGGK